jgi:hypothetical protein
MKNSLYQSIERVYKANYLGESRWLRGEDFAAEIWGKMPRAALAASMISIENSMGFVRDKLEREGYLMIANVEVDKKKINGRKLARPEDIDSIITELQRRAKRRNGSTAPLKRAIENVDKGGLLPPGSQFIPQLNA